MEKTTEVTETVETPVAPAPEATMKLEDLQAFLETTVNKAVEKYGIDKLDLKNAKLPGTEDVDVTGLSDLQAKHKKFQKFVRTAITKANNAESSDSVGGALVPIEFIADVAALLKDYGMFRKYATVFKMNSKTATMPALSGQASGAFVNEAAAKPISNNTFNKITFTRHTYAFISKVSREIMQDSGVDLMKILAEYAANDMARAEDIQGFLGTGSPITGINSASGVNVVHLSTTLASSLTYQKILELIYAIPSNYAGNAAFYMHRSVWSAILGLEDGGDNLIWSPNMVEPNILGYPVRLTEVLNATSVTGSETPYVIFGDLKNAWLGEREGFRVDVADQAYVGSEDLFGTNQLAFRFEESFDIEIVLPGAFSVLREVAS